MVGCVIVAADGAVVGEGTYTYDGVVHAEATALAEAGNRAIGGTAYVSLEPHSHFGKTPPCTDALIAAGIRRVVCPIEDPNPKVSGRGFEHLREAGIEVVTGILAREATRLNEKFICWHEKGRPFVHLKLAMSLDGRISLGPSVSTAISGKKALERVHDLRHEHDAILIGSNTAFTDDPSLTDRSGKPRRRPLTRVILDNRLRLPLGSSLVRDAAEMPTMVFTNSADSSHISALESHGVKVEVSASGGRDLAHVLEKLKDLQIQSVLVEGGSEVAGAFVDSGLVDKVTLIFSPFIIGGRIAPSAISGKGADTLSDVMRLQDVSVEDLDGDILISGYPGGSARTMDEA